MHKCNVKMGQLQKGVKGSSSAMEFRHVQAHLDDGRDGRFQLNTPRQKTAFQ